LLYILAAIDEDELLLADFANGYSRGEESAADRHAVDILNRAGYSKVDLINILKWFEREYATRVQIPCDDGVPAARKTPELFRARA
jgi:predicted Zn-dependent protease